MGERKESGIEKLIELLNEYEKKERKSEFYEWEKGIGGKFNLFRRDTYDEEGSHIYSDTADTYVISKKFGFIKWLVENDKIDRDRVEDSIPHIFFGYMNYQILLMLLSISNSPIDDLILYLI